MSTRSYERMKERHEMEFQNPTPSSRILLSYPLAKRFYVAGKMTGEVDLNFAAFAAEAKSLRAQGFEVISPHELDIATGFTPEKKESPTHFQDCMRRDIEAILTCEGIVLLPGWETSTGTAIEITVAYGLGLEILRAGTMVPLTDEDLQAHLKLPGYRAPGKEMAA